MSTVSDLVSYLDRSLPFDWAEEWDRVGLLAGDPGAPVARVFVSLDATETALQRARAAGANVLLTHHPAFLDPLESVTPDPMGAAVVYAALSSGIALVNCHTNLDRSPEGADALPLILGLTASGALEEAADGISRPVAGRVCSLGEGETLGSFATTVAERLGVSPKVWGDPEMSITSVGIAPGSGGSLVDAARAAGCDVLLTGELRYHGSLAALESGLAVIEAGHDATEWPLTRALAEIAASAPGLEAGAVVLDEIAYRWWIA